MQTENVLSKYKAALWKKEIDLKKDIDKFFFPAEIYFLFVHSDLLHVCIKFSIHPYALQAVIIKYLQYLLKYLLHYSELAVNRSTIAF